MGRLVASFMHFADGRNRKLRLFAARQFEGGGGNFQGIVATGHQFFDHLLFAQVMSSIQLARQLAQQLYFAVTFNLLHRGQGCLGHALFAEAFDAAQHPLFLGRHQRDGDAALAGAPGAPNAVDVDFRILGQIKVEDVGDVVDVEAAGRHIGGHKHLDLILAEAGQHAFARFLAEIPIEDLCRVAAGGQFVGQFAGAGACLGEDEATGHRLYFEETGER